MYGHATKTENGDSGIGITGFTIDGTITSDDYDNFPDATGGRYCDDIAISTLGTGSFKNFTLNALGLANISKTTSSGFFVRTSNDIDNTTPAGATFNNKQSYWFFRASDYVGYTPYLEVTYHIPDSTPPASITGLTSTDSAYSIKFDWTNPTEDYDHLYVLKDNVFLQNVTAPTATLTLSSLTPRTSYILSTKTVDATGNMNTTWVNLTATTTNVTSQSDLGWITLINNSWISNSVTHNNTFIADGFNTGGLVGETMTVNTNNLSLAVTSSNVGQMYIGQLYPAGHTKYRFNMSVVRNDSNPQITIYNGRLFHIVIFGLAGGQYIRVYHYNSTGSVITDDFDFGTSFADFNVEYYENGTAVFTNNNNAAQTVTTKYHLDWQYPYNYISCPIIQIKPELNTGTSMQVVLYNFEQSVPKTPITVWADNSDFAFAMDVRPNYVQGTDWLVANNQRSTLMMDAYGQAFLNTTSRAELVDLVQNHGFELGEHFSGAWATKSDAEILANMTSERIILSSAFGTDPLSFIPTSGSNSTHAQWMWSNYSTLWRGAPYAMEGSYGDSIYAMYEPYAGTGADTIIFWKIASQYKSFNPAYTHSIMEPLGEADSVSLTNFTTIMGNYNTGGVRMVPYAEWYYENANTVQPITNVLLSSTDSHFSIDTQSYNATTTVYDPFSEGVWYSTGGTVWTTIDGTANPTNLTIKNTVTNPVVQKANATLIPSSDSVVVNVSVWNTTGDYKKKWREGSTNAAVTTQHQIGDLQSGHTYRVKKDGVSWHTYVANASGYITFNYDEGYSDHEFEIDEIMAPVAAFSANVTSGAAPLAIKFTDASTNTPTSWNWSYKNATGSWIPFSTDQNPEGSLINPGVYSINLTATNDGGSDDEIKVDYITVTNGTATPTTTSAIPTGYSTDPPGWLYGAITIGGLIPLIFGLGLITGLLGSPRPDAAQVTMGVTAIVVGTLVLGIMILFMITLAGALGA